MNTALKLSGTKVYWHRNYANGKEYSGLPVGPGTYLRLVGWLTPTGSDTSVPRYDIKVGKGTSDGDLTRIKGTNQTLHPREFAWIPGTTDDDARKLEGKLRNYFVENGWQETDEEKYNIKGVEHVHKQFNSKEDDKLAIAEIESLICSFFNTPPAPKLSFREIQKEAIEHLCEALSAAPEHRCLALAIATGGGKTILGLQFFIQLRHLGKIKNGDVVAMVSPNKDAQHSFIDDVNKFYPDDFNIITQDELLSGKLAKDKINLLLIGTQWLSNGPEDSLNYDLLCKRYGAGLSDIKAFVFDEAHRAFFGKNKTNQTEKIAKEIMSHNPYTLWLSGTAAALLANLRENGWLRDGGEFCFTLAQLLANRCYIDKDLPSLKWMQLGNVPNFPSEESNALFTSGKLLSGNQQIELEDFVNKFFYSNGSHNLFNVGRKHILISVNTQSQVDCLKDMLEQEMPPRLKSKLDVVTITGDSDGKITDLINYKQHIKQSKYSITITCKRWLEAVNVPCWDTLMMLGSTETYEFMFQALGRLFRVYNGKKEVWVCDVKLNRHIEFFHNLRKELQAAEQNLVEWDLKKLYRLVPIFFCKDVGFQQQKLEFDAFEDAMQSYVDTIQSNRDFFSDSDFNLKINGLNALSNIGVGSNKAKTILMKVANGAQGKDVERTKKQLDSAGVEATNENGQLKVKIANLEKLKKLFKNIEVFLSFTDICSWQELKNYKNKPFFEEATLIDLDIFIQLVYNGLVSVDRVEQFIKHIDLHREL